ncbi:hypothetical protein F1880_008734 [Penicillium rolfsii]|nr:hypothetical protein F1880_008734 [Penicillium rolfsii]
MAGSPASEVSEHQSRKRRGSHITPDKAKKSTSSQSSSRIDQSTVKPASMTPAVVDATTSNILSPGKGPSAVKDKSKGPVSKGSTKPKVTKPDLMGEASKAKSGKLPVKEQEFDGNDQTAVKMDDTKANKKPAAQDKKPDTKENTVENKRDPKKLNSRDKKEKKDDGRDKLTKS